MSSMIIRPAEFDDLPGVCDTYLQCWRTNYRVVLAPEAIAAMTPMRVTEYWHRAYRHPETRLDVAVIDGEVRGLVRHGLVRGNGIVFSLYIHPTAQGQGVGTALLESAGLALTRAGATQLRAWLFNGNASSEGFYHSLGWRRDGAEKVEAEFGQQIFRMVRPALPQLSSGLHGLGLRSLPASTFQTDGYSV